jgi:ADP-L-glycero-D-manno-heptose 6-epimerase
MHTQANISNSQVNLNFEPKISLEKGINSYIPEIKRLHGEYIL